MNESSSSIDKGGGEKGDFKYENQFFSLQDIYRLLGFSTDPTDRELEAKIIMYMRKYNGYKSGEDDRRLYDFFDRLYDHLFDTNENDVEIVEGFVSQSSSIGAGGGATGVSSGGATGVSSGGGGGGGGGGATGVSSGGGGGGGGGNADSGGGGSTGAAPGSVVQTVNPVSYSKDNLNPILKQTIQRIISIDSRYRNLNRISTSINSLATNFTIELSEPLRDVLSLKLYSYQIPYTWYTVNKDFGSNFFIIKGNVPGLTDEYKFVIEPGNYSATTLTEAINNSIKAMALENIDVSFGNTSLKYNVNTTVATFNIEIKKCYQESQFELDWVNWASPISTGINRDSNSSNNGILNIPQYLGFDYQIYNLNSINSFRNVLPILPNSNSNTDDIKDYYINSSNNYFKVISYIPTLTKNGSIWSVNSYDDTFNIRVLDTITITLNLEEGGYSRNQIVTEVNRQISISPYFLDTGYDALTRYNQKDGNNSFFNFSLVLDRKIISFNNSISSKTVVVFPTEEIPANTYSPNYVWTGPNSCFQFDTSFVELSDVVAEYPLFRFNYFIEGIPYIKFNVINEHYNQNTFLTFVNRSSDLGFSSQDYFTDINNAISDKSRIIINGISSTDISFGTFTIGSSTSNRFYIKKTEDNLIPTFDFSFNYTFNSKDYYVQFNNEISIDDSETSSDPINFKLGDDFGIQGTTQNEITDGYTQFLYSNKNQFNFDLSQNINVRANYRFYIDSGLALLKIIPNNTDYATEFNIPFRTTKIYENDGVKGFYQYAEFDLLISDIRNSIRNYKKINTDTEYPLINSSVESISIGAGWNIQINIVIQKVLSQKDCTVSLYDKNTNFDITYSIDNLENYSSGAPYSTWGSYLNFKDSSYELSSISTISGRGSVKETTVVKLTNSNNKFYLRPQGYSAGLVTGVSGSYINSKYNDILISLEPGTYSINSLFNALNVAFSNNEFTRGTNLRYVSKGGKNYCVLRTNINRIFYSKDYAVNFYDLTSFVKCYVGSSARNTTWDSTIGWILGFHEKTVYELSSYDYIGTTNSINISGELSVNTNLYSYFLISVDDFNQNRLNDGLVTITRPEQQVSLPSYSAIADFSPDYNGNVGTSGSNVVAENNLTANQVYSINQILEARKNTSKIYSQGPFVKDIFGYIPLKLPSTPGDMITEYGGTLQNQDRLYFGPVNIRRLQVQLINDKGTVMDLNGADWSFSFICEQLYQKKMT